MKPLEGDPVTSQENSESTWAQAMTSDDRSVLGEKFREMFEIALSEYDNEYDTLSPEELKVFWTLFVLHVDDNVQFLAKGN